MDYFELIKTRQSVRKFKDTPVPVELLRNCVEAARIAPSACNGQPWRFVIVTGEDSVKKVREAVTDKGMNKFTENCPAFIAVIEGKTVLTAKVGGLYLKTDFPQIDIGLATMQLVLAAETQGLSTCIMGWVKSKTVEDLLDLKSGEKLRLVVAVGYGDAPQRDKKRKSFGEICAEI